jgi:1,2-diacylglycerol 3-beta-galactosyltransferase
VVKPKIAILMADSGGGHRAAAISLAEALEGQADAELLNLLDQHAPFPFNRFSVYYGRLVDRSPSLYHLIYRAASSQPALRMAQVAAYSVSQTRLVSAFRVSDPDLVISVHPLQNALALKALRDAGNRAPFLTVVTDPFSVHPSWFCPGVDLCIVASEDARRAALEAGISPSRVRIVGLPIRQTFVNRPAESKSELRARLGLSQEMPLVLLAGGGAGLGNLERLAKTISDRIAGSPRPAQIAIITGRNLALKRRLEAKAWASAVTILGFVTNVAEWMAAADLLVMKAGPGMLAEAMALGLPIIMTDFVPGQEEGNVRWVVTTGAGLFERNASRVARLVEELLAPPQETLARMSACGLSAAKPTASKEIARLAVDLWRQGERSGA